MKILLLSPLPPPSGGIATWTLGYTAWLDAKNIEYTLINTATGGKRLQDFNSYSILYELTRAKEIQKKVIETLKENEYDIMHLNSSCGWKGMLRDIKIIKKAKTKGVKVIIHCHCNLNAYKDSVLATRYIKKAFALCDKIILLNALSFNHAITLTNKEKCVITPNFVQDVVIKERQHNDNIKSALYVGHIAYRKGSHTILKVAQERSDIQFNMIGSLSQEIKQLPTPDNVHYLGEMTRDKVIENMYNSDVFFFPSHSEGFPGVVAEAMATGLPIVTTRVGAIEDMTEGKGAVYFDIDDVDSALNALDCIAPKAVREKMSAWTIDKVQCEYTIDTVMNRYSEIYKELVND